MPATIPESHLDLIAGPVYAVLTTISPDGGPENTVIWCSWDGSHILVNTADGRRKIENVRNNPKVAVFAMDPEDPFRWVDVRGGVDAIEADPDASNINSHCFLYTGNEEYYGSVAPADLKGKESRMILRIKPERVVIFPPADAS